MLSSDSFELICKCLENRIKEYSSYASQSDYIAERFAEKVKKTQIALNELRSFFLENL